MSPHIVSEAGKGVLTNRGSPELYLTFSVTHAVSALRAHRPFYISLSVPSLSISARTEAIPLPTQFVTPIRLPACIPLTAMVIIGLHDNSARSPRIFSMSFSHLCAAQLSSVCITVGRRHTLRPQAMMEIHVEPSPSTRGTDLSFGVIARGVIEASRVSPLPLPECQVVVSRRRGDGSWAPIFRSAGRGISRATSTPLTYDVRCSSQRLLVTAYRLSGRRGIVRATAGATIVSIGEIIGADSKKPLPLMGAIGGIGHTGHVKILGNGMKEGRVNLQVFLYGRRGPSGRRVGRSFVIMPERVSAAGLPNDGVMVQTEIEAMKGFGGGAGVVGVQKEGVHRGRVVPWTGVVGDSAREGGKGGKSLGENNKSGG